MYFNNGDFSSINGRQFVDERNGPPVTVDKVSMGVPGVPNPASGISIEWEGSDYTGITSSISS